MKGSVKPETLRRQYVTRLNVSRPFITQLALKSIKQVDGQFHAA